MIKPMPYVEHGMDRGWEYFDSYDVEEFCDYKFITIVEELEDSGYQIIKIEWMHPGIFRFVFRKINI